MERAEYLFTMNQCREGPELNVSQQIAKQGKYTGHRKQLYKKERN